jgi:chromosomal replication initiation ATPase DnaA
VLPVKGSGQQSLPLHSVRPEAALLVAASNRAAVELVLDPAWTGGLYLEGPPASGKTLLLATWAAQTGAMVVSAATLNLDGAAHLAGSGPVGVEDVDRLTGPESEEALFHLLNALARQSGRLLMTGRCAPRALVLGLADLRTRLNALPIARIEPPEDELLARLLLHLAEARQLVLPQPVADFLVARMARSHQAAINLIEALDRLSLEARRPVSRELGAEALRRLGF